MTCGSSIDCAWGCPGCEHIELREGSGRLVRTLCPPHITTDTHGIEYDQTLLDLIPEQEIND